MSSPGPTGEDYAALHHPTPEGHDYDIDLSAVRGWQESMPVLYSRQNLGEADYVPAPHDLVVNRYVRGAGAGGEPHAEPFYGRPGDGPDVVGV